MDGGKSFFEQLDEVNEIVDEANEKISLREQVARAIYEVRTRSISWEDLSEVVWRVEYLRMADAAIQLIVEHCDFINTEVYYDGQKIALGSDYFVQEMFKARDRTIGRDTVKLLEPHQRRSLDSLYEARSALDYAKQQLGNDHPAYEILSRMIVDSYAAEDKY